MSALSEDRLVGRAAELAALEALIAATAAGEPGIAVVRGEAGIGKTRLLAEAGRSAGLRGVAALSGSAAEFERELPFGMFVDALDPYLGSLDPALLSRLENDGLACLGPVLPSLGERGVDAPVPGGAAERFRLYRAVRDLLERLGTRQPILVMLDDVHWADPASAELLAHLVRRPPAAPVGLVISHRSGRLADAPAAALLAASQAGAISEIELGPLDERAAAELIDSPSAGLYERAGGNPFYLLQLARQDVPEGEVVPTAVLASIARELDALQDRARELARAGSALGDPFEVHLAATVAGLTAAEGPAALDELIACDLVRATGDPGRFRFRHPLVRSAVYGGWGPGGRLAAHGRAARALASRGEGPAAFAHHVAVAAAPGDREAIRILEESAVEVAGRAPDLAALWLERAVALLPTAGDARDDRRRLLSAIGEARMGAGRLTASASAFDRALELADTAADRLRLLERSATVEILAGDRARARSHLEEMSTLAEGPDDRASAAIALSITAYYAADFAEMRRVADSAVQEARDPSIAAAAQAARVLGSCEAGEIHSALGELPEAAARMDALSDAELALRLDAALDLGIAELILDRPEDALRHLRRGIDVSRREHVGHFLHHLLAWSAVAEERRGRLDEALGPSDDAEQIARLTQVPLALMWTLCWRSRIALRSGDRELALAAAREGLALLPAEAQVWPAASLQVAHAGALLALGHPADAEAAVLNGCGGSELGLLGWSARPDAHELLAAAAASLGRPADAMRWADAAEADAAETGRSRACALRARSLALRAAGDDTGAADAALAAVDVVPGLPLEQAQSRRLAGEALAGSDRGGAVTLLRQAHEAYVDAGAARDAQDAERTLRRLGVRTWRRGPASAEGTSLSEREREVALLAARGLTNPDIARELFLSVKTVETHLRNVFRKLGVTSRVQLAARDDLRRAADA